MAIYQPRPYQTECIKALAGARANGTKEGLVVMASGLGKTLTTIFDLQQFFETNPSARVLYLCHQESILSQSKSKFRKVFGEEYSYGMFTGFYKTTHPVNFLFATFQTMRDHREEFATDAFDYIIVDEAHHTAAETYQPTADYFEPQFLLGLTATKDRMDGQDILATYKRIIYQMDLYDGWVEDWLAHVDYRIMLDDLNQKEFEKYVGPQAGTEKVSLVQLNRTIFAPQRDAEIVKSIREQTADLENPSIFVFCSNIEHANAMAKHFGKGAAVIHSAQNASLNEAILADFRAGRLNVVISVNMLNEGIDVPMADAVVFLRATESSTIFLQQLGRGLRISGNKRMVRVLDFVCNVERISMILEMEETVKKRIAANPNYTPSTNKPTPLIVNIPATTFQIQKVDVEQLLLRLRRAGSMTDEELLEGLKRKAEELGRAPSKLECDRDGILPSAYVYIQRFGSWNNAMQAANLDVYEHVKQGTWNSSRIIAALQSKAQELDRSLTMADCGRDNDMPSASTVKCVFGSWSNALIQAGLESYKNSRWTEISAAELIDLLLAKASKIGRTPTQKSVDRDPEMPSSKVYKRVFGGWNAAIRAAGLIENS